MGGLESRQNVNNLYPHLRTIADLVFSPRLLSPFLPFFYLALFFLPSDSFAFVLVCADPCEFEQFTKLENDATRSLPRRLETMSDEESNVRLRANYRTDNLAKTISRVRRDAPRRI